MSNVADTEELETQIDTEPRGIDPELLRRVLSDDMFLPTEPRTIEETGLSQTFIEALLCKHMMVSGASSGRTLAEQICLPFGIISSILDALHNRRLISHAGSAPLNDFIYLLTESGFEQTQSFNRQCSYAGPAPVPLAEYIDSVEAQSIAVEAPNRETLMSACEGISVDPKVFTTLGPALNSCGGMFLYGSPGNGKTTLARHVTRCFGQNIWIPHAIIEDGEIVKLYDAQYHINVQQAGEGFLKESFGDPRWVNIVRPTVVIGGELTMENLELKFNHDANISEAPLQLKSNCGCLLIDDFGRQRIAPDDLLNRWIVPLEEHHDFLTLPSGKKIRVPFQQLILFSTNLEPEQLVDEAFLRRIPYKIRMDDPSDEEFQHLFQLYCTKFGCEYRKDVVNYLLDEHYKKCGRAKRRCHARDLLSQIKNYCSYNGLEFEIRPEYFDMAVSSYFAMVLKT